MLQEMRQIALDYLYHELETKQPVPIDLNQWYKEYSTNKPGEIISYLIETVEEGKQVVLFEPDPQDDDLINVSLTEVKNDSYRYPFVKGPSNGAQIGPVLKIGINKDKEISPKPRTMKKTLEKWREYATAKEVFSSYFKEVVDILSRPQINILDKITLQWASKNHDNPIDCFINREGKEFVNSLLVIKKLNGELPGESYDYSVYLQMRNNKKYITDKVPSLENKTCSLCQKKHSVVFPNGVKGAGINLGNVDREGSFGELSLNNAWKNFSICGICADLLYVYKNHVLKKHYVTEKRPYQTRIAGEPALIVPSISNDPRNRQKVMKRIIKTVDHATTDTDTVERRLWNVLKTEKAILNINIFWLTIGQVIGDLDGSVTDIPPTRLRELSKFNDQAREWDNPIFPKIKIDSLYSVDLSLNSLKDIFKHPGGKKVKTYNTSKKLFRLRKNITKCVYHETQIDEESFWSEIMITAKTYLDDIIQTENSKKPWKRIVSEGVTKEGKEYLTFAGWVRHLAWWLYYFRKIGVMKMNKNTYQPKTDLLNPYFSEESGIDTYEKAFAFTLGILYGRLLTLQGGKKINVGANALTWLKRLTLKGSDLPELYVKTRGKLLAYNAEGREEVREVIRELGHLGNILGDSIQLDSVPTNFFLLLGQSVSSEIIPTKSKDEENKND